VHVDTPLVSRVGSSGEVAVVAETEAQERSLLRAALREVGYEVTVAADAEQLDALFRARALLEAPSPLVVLSVGLAKRCAGALAAVAAQRARAGAAEVSLILTYERETLTTVVRPSLGPCSLVAIFEKPFDLDELRSVARATRLAAEGASRRPSRP